jgi:cell division protein FtsB
MLLLGLLGGGLTCLLVVNTTLAANSIQINRLEQANAAGTQQVQQLQQEVAAQQSAAVIAKEARKLGMRPEVVPAFLDLRTHSRTVSSGPAR